MDQKIGFIGLGIMGSAMSANLLKAGFSVIGYDVVPKQLEAFTNNKGIAASSCKEVGEKSEVVITSLPSVDALDKVINSESGIIASGNKGLVVIETSTLPLSAKKESYRMLKAAGIVMLDCPLSGTGAQAVTKDLAIYCSGEQDVYENCLPIFEGFTRTSFYVGEFGRGTAMKMVANHLVTIHNAATAEALVLGMKSGLEPQLILEAISAGAATSRIFEIRGPLMVEERYDEPTMKVDMHQKDIRIINDFANDLNCPTPLMSAAAQLYTAALAKGQAKQDTASICKVLEEMADLKRENSTQ